MPDAGAQTIAIVLESLDDLFSAPQLYPLAGRFETSSGIERIEQLTRALPRQDRAGAEIVITLSHRVDDPQLDENVRAALVGYSQARIAEITRDLEHSMHAGRDALWLGLGFLACCLALSSAFSAVSGLPDFIRRLFSEGLIIAGWVALWRPIELLLYDAWPFRRDVRVLRAIAGMSVRIVQPTLPAATAAATTATA